MKRLLGIAILITLFFVSVAAIGNTLYIYQAMRDKTDTNQYKIDGLKYDNDNLNQELKNCYNAVEVQIQACYSKVATSSATPSAGVQQ